MPPRYVRSTRIGTGKYNMPTDDINKHRNDKSFCIHGSALRFFARVTTSSHAPAMTITEHYNEADSKMLSRPLASLFEWKWYEVISYRLRTRTRAAKLRKKHHSNNQMRFVRDKNYPFRTFTDKIRVHKACQPLFMYLENLLHYHGIQAPAR